MEDEDGEHGPYDYDCIRKLLIAVMAQAVEDCLKGYPGAREWMNSRGFEHYCEWLEIDPTAARRGIAGQMSERRARYKEADLRRVKELHDRGVGWVQGMERVFGYYSETLRQVVNEYDRLHRRIS